MHVQVEAREGDEACDGHGRDLERQHASALPRQTAQRRGSGERHHGVVRGERIARRRRDEQTGELVGDERPCAPEQRLQHEHAEDRGRDDGQEYGYAPPAVPRLRDEHGAGDEPHEGEVSQMRGQQHDLVEQRRAQMLLDGVNIKTSLPSPDTFVQKFKAAKEAGDEVICILIASKLSGTYQGAMLAKQIVDYDGIHVIDAGHAAASVAEKMLVIAACRMRDQGCKAEEIARRLEQLRGSVRLIACLDTLEYLARGGRLPAAVASIGTKLQLKPIIVFGENGEIQVVKKCMGSKRAMRDMTEMVTECRVNPEYR